jgi:hypothetical protein
MDHVRIFYGHLSILRPFGIFTAIWYISWPFGICFYRFGMLYQEKSGNPAALES